MARSAFTPQKIPLTCLRLSLFSSCGLSVISRAGSRDPQSYTRLSVPVTYFAFTCNPRTILLTPWRRPLAQAFQVKHEERHAALISVTRLYRRFGLPIVVSQSSAVFIGDFPGMVVAFSMACISRHWFVQHGALFRYTVCLIRSCWRSCDVACQRDACTC